MPGCIAQDLPKPQYSYIYPWRQVTEVKLKMVILGSLPPIFDRITSAWDSSHLPERTLTALTSKLLIEELRTLVKHSGGKHPDNVAFFADSSAEKQGYAAQGCQRGGRGDNRDCRDERGRPNRGDYQGREGREHDNPDSIKKDRWRHYYNKSNNLQINSRTRFRHETENRPKETRSDLTSKNRVDNTKKTSLYSSSSICFSARSPRYLRFSQSSHVRPGVLFFLNGTESERTVASEGYLMNSVASSRSRHNWQLLQLIINLTPENLEMLCSFHPSMHIWFQLEQLPMPVPKYCALVTRLSLKCTVKL